MVPPSGRPAGGVVLCASGVLFSCTQDDPLPRIRDLFLDGHPVRWAGSDGLADGLQRSGGPSGWLAIASPPTCCWRYPCSALPFGRRPVTASVFNGRKSALVPALQIGGIFAGDPGHPNFDGGFTAGLKAGHVSSTWPLMMGKLFPPTCSTHGSISSKHPRPSFYPPLVCVAGNPFRPLCLLSDQETELQPISKSKFLWLTGVVALQITLAS